MFKYHSVQVAAWFLNMYRIVLQFYFDSFSVYRTLHERSKTHSSEGSLQSGKETKPNPVMSPENRPVDISSAFMICNACM